MRVFCLKIAEYKLNYVAYIDQTAQYCRKLPYTSHISHIMHTINYFSYPLNV